MSVANQRSDEIARIRALNGSSRGSSSRSSSTASMSREARSGRIRNAVLGSHRAEQRDYGTGGPPHEPAAAPSGAYIPNQNRNKFGLPPPPAYESIPLQTAPLNLPKSRYGMSSGGGPSSINIFSHEGQGSSSPYARNGGAIVASRSFKQSPLSGSSPISKEERPNQYSQSSPTAAESIFESRSRLGLAGQSMIGRSSMEKLPPAFPSNTTGRGSSWGGGDSSGVASILSWADSNTPSTSYYRTSHPSKSTAFSSHELPAADRAITLPGLGSAAADVRRIPGLGGGGFHNSGSSYVTNEHYQSSIRVSRPPGGGSSWSPGWQY